MRLKKIIFTVSIILLTFFIPYLLLESFGGSRRGYSRNIFDSYYALGALGSLLVIVIGIVSARVMKIKVGPGFWLFTGMAFFSAFTATGFILGEIRLHDTVPQIVMMILYLIQLVGFITFIVEAFRNDPIPLSFERGIASGESSQVSSDELQAVVAKIRGLA